MSLAILIQFRPQIPVMNWRCIDCGAEFQGRANIEPPNGCRKCGSHKLVDRNINPVKRADFSKS